VSADPEAHSEPGQADASGRRAPGKSLIYAAAVAVTILLAGGAWYFLGMHSAGRGDDQARQLTETEAAKGIEVANQLEPVKSQLRSLAGDTVLINLFAAADTAGLEREAAQRLPLFEAGLKLRLLLPGNYEVDNTASPPLGYASLDLLHRAEATGAAVHPEVVMPGSDSAHIVFIEPVLDAAGAPVGLIHLSVNTAMLDQALAGLAQPSAYLELQQIAGEKTLVLTSAGNADFKQGEPRHIRVPGTDWDLSYWGGEATGPAPGGVSLLYPLVLAVLLALAGIAAVVFLRRRRSGAEPAGAAAPAGAPVIYAGAIKAIMEGAHPGMEKLIPNLESMQAWNGNPLPISQGMSGDDITMIASAAKQQAATGDFFDLTGGGNPADEAITEPKADQAKPAPDAQTPAAQVEISPTIFRTYDIRGVVGKDLTPETVQKIGQAIGSEAAARNQQKVAVGRDGRTSGPELVAALIAGLRAAGRDVIDIGMVPTPVLYFATHTLDTASGVMLTGSHNGPEYNGLKIVLAGETLSQDAIQDLRLRILENDLLTGRGELCSREITVDYIRRISEDIPVALGGAFKLVVDCGNGVAGAVAPQLYRALGHDVIELYCEVDGKFPNHHPDPSQPENLVDLIAKVRDSGADLGFAFDGDADRLGVVDNLGNIIWPDRQLMVLARDVLTRNPGASIIYDVKCSRHLRSIITAGGGQPLMWKTGHSLIKNKMKEVQAPLAGEMSGHIFFKERWYGFDDALYTGARMLEVLMRAKVKPAEVFASIPEAVATPELRVALPETEHQGFMRQLQDKIAFAGAEVFDVDGFRVEFPDGWGLVRPSNTSPYLVLRFEADNAEALARIQSQFHKLLLAIKADLTLPF
jgi:phosphomannomutase/phosphoglucomutase